jgi:hypothetical protein
MSDIFIPDDPQLQSTVPYAVGDILFADTPSSLDSLPIGTSGQVLNVGASGVPQWSSVLPIGPQDTDGSWRISISGVNLLVENRVGGVWVEKGRFIP